MEKVLLDTDIGGDIGLPEHTGPDRVVDIVVDIRHPIGKADDPALERHGRRAAGMAADAVPDLDGQVQPPSALL